MEKGKHDNGERIQLPNEEGMREINLDEGYKHLGILKVDGMKDKEREKIEKEYYTRLRKILKSKLNGPNKITATNSRAVSIVRYGAGIIKWTKEKLGKMDRKTRKLMNCIPGTTPTNTCRQALC